MNDALRAARERAALTQADLADLAGVSRQLVGAVEAGRNTPAVGAALRIAAVLGVSVEALFGEAVPPAASVLGDELQPGEAVLVGRVGDALRAVPLRSLAAGDMGWSAADGVVEGAGIRLLPGAQTTGFVVVGCDPVLGLCETLLNRGPARRLLAVAGSSGTAAAALARGHAHAALVHGPSGALPAAPAGTRRVHLAAWRVGIGTPGSGRSSLEAALEGPGMIQREGSAASQQALMRAVRATGGRAPRVLARASGHIDAARRALLEGCAAVTFEPAAHQHGLGFVPLETHVVELWIDERWVEHPGATALCDLLTSEVFRRRVGLVGGYELRDCGALRSAA